MMNAPEDIIGGAATYLRLYFLCIPAQMTYNTGASLMRARGDSRHPLIFLAISGATNLILNILFVALFHWDVVGVAAATVITQYLSACLVLRALMREEEAWRLDLRKLCLRKEKIARILRIGIPAGLQAAMLAASDIPLQTCVNSLGFPGRIGKRRRLEYRRSHLLHDRIPYPGVHRIHGAMRRRADV